MVEYCARAKYTILRACWDGCWKEITNRCPVSKMCFNCSIWRRNVILARLYSVYEETKESIQDIVLWTIGTELENTLDGRKKLSEYWKYFRARMNKKAEWNPLFRVVEYGSRGKRLHIHFLNNGFLKHKNVLHAWREVTNSKTNVNFSKKAMPPEMAIRYAGKYLTKDLSKFTFLGDWYGQKKQEYNLEPCEHGVPYSFYNVITDYQGIKGQTTIEDQTT